jgi:hypothetical protein
VILSEVPVNGRFAEFLVEKPGTLKNMKTIGADYILEFMGVTY